MNIWLFVWIHSLCLLSSVDTAEICSSTSNNSLPNIYAADNLKNGTVRLFSGDRYYELELYQLMTNVTRFDSVEKNPIMLNISDRRVAGRIDQTGERNTSSVLKNLNFTIVDTDDIQWSIVSLTDYEDFELTLLFPSASKKKSNSIHLGSQYHAWNGENGEFVRSVSIDEEHTKNHKLILNLITFRAYIHQREYLFMSITGKLLCGKVTIKSHLNFPEPTNLVRCDSMKNGDIPPNLTASFVIQLNSDQLWVVLIRCNRFCLVPWLPQFHYFNFTECNTTLWKPMSGLFDLANDHLYLNDSVPIRNYIPSNKAHRRSRFWSTFSLSTFFCFVLIFTGMLTISFFYYRHHRGESYNLAAVEALEVKRAQKEINEDDRAKDKVVVIGTGGDGADLVAADSADHQADSDADSDPSLGESRDPIEDSIEKVMVAMQQDNDKHRDDLQPGDASFMLKW